MRTLSELVTIESTKILPNEFAAEEYISTDNMVSDLGGIKFGKSNVPNGKSTKYSVGDVLFSNIRTYFRKVWLSDRAGACSNDVLVFRPIEALVTPQFLYYTLIRPDFTAYSARTSRGAKMPRGDKSAMLDFQIHVPELEEQCRIVSILEVFDSKIQLDRDMFQTLNAIAGELYTSWFVNFDPVQSKSSGGIPDFMDSDTASLFPASFDGEGLPDGWTKDSIAHYMHIKGGTQPPKSSFLYKEEAGYIRLVQIRDYESDSKITFVRDSSSLRRCGPFDVMIGRYGASVGRVGWGLSGAYNVALVKAEPHRPSDQEFIRAVCNCDEFQQYIQSISGRSAQAGFNKSDIAAFLTCCGTDAIRDAFSSVIRPLRERQLQLMDEIRTLEALRDALLPPLLSGGISFDDIKKQFKEVA
ncbi:type I restriction enzyme, S subunit [Loktanella salsilacus]|uniref:Type I restriction enzyme, S subunit n=1 Tax=Loktanella salsilacus TaxID=195913 RepID=A0A1I4H8L3_9RHOB|nr:restriction endonuclease subunit S [Loktanella salsilacus]SFL38628.1 type I restriction enzyme, S subunit [Loktanella salsilacus]